MMPQTVLVLVWRREITRYDKSWFGGIPVASIATLKRTDTKEKHMLTAIAGVGG